VAREQAAREQQQQASAQVSEQEARRLKAETRLRKQEEADERERAVHRRRAEEEQQRAEARIAKAAAKEVAMEKEEEARQQRERDEAAATVKAQDRIVGDDVSIKCRKAGKNSIMAVGVDGTAHLERHKSDQKVIALDPAGMAHPSLGSGGVLAMDSQGQVFVEPEPQTPRDHPRDHTPAPSSHQQEAVKETAAGGTQREEPHAAGLEELSTQEAAESRVEAEPPVEATTNEAAPGEAVLGGNGDGGATTGNGSGGGRLAESAASELTNMESAEQALQDEMDFLRKGNAVMYRGGEEATVVAIHLEVPACTFRLSPCLPLLAWPRSRFAL